MAQTLMKFSYKSYVAWISQKTKMLVSGGFEVSIHENIEPIKSLLLKAANKSFEAELVVWETGTTSMIVYNIEKNHYDLDRHDIVLSDEEFDLEIGLFFNSLMPNPK